MAGASGSPQEWVRRSVMPNGLAIITLDRPKALNAMNVDMTALYKKYMDEWSTNNKVHAVLVESSSPRAFSAGMDVKGVAAALQKDLEMPMIPEVFSNEYKLICAIAHYPKPYIAFMDGITMGFGIGISGHGRFRVITERTVLAMPENGIGLFPDVGFAHIAASTPGHGAVGTYMAMTGAKITTPADANYLGLGTHYIPSTKLESLKLALLHADLSSNALNAIEMLLEGYKVEPETESSLKPLLPAITACFGANLSIVDTVDALKQHQASDDSAVAGWAKGALAGLAKGAPFSLCVTKHHFAAVAAITNADQKDDLSQIEGVMKIEFRLGIRTSTRPDFIEGVRAVLVDKDQRPKWQPGSIEDVDMDDVKAVFAPFETPADELKIPDTVA
ncbi:unnamed protein product [Sphagnum jensenii]|uniref:3-hydroxyisobutyryl-CoA hydrolase n=1 Tax=Sphagnum jensenii TaxID=128206 RepID=A0ABP1A792_9BRYO